MTVTEDSTVGATDAPPAPATPASPASPATSPDKFAERIFGAFLGAQEVQAIYLGERLGWYRTLAERGPLTSGELAEATDTAERYAREWLEHQAVSGYLTVDDANRDALTRRYSLPAGHAEVLTDIDSPLYLAPLARFIAASNRQLDPILDAYRTGGGVSWEQFGEDAREAQAALNRPLFLHSLCQELLPAVPDIHDTLTDGARVADIGSGAGWSSIALAKGYPRVTVDGFDPDTASVRLAERNAAAYGVAGRITFTDVDAAQAADAATAGTYDIVFAFECVHDMSDPVAVLAAARRLLRAGGQMVVMDERSEETFRAPGTEVERLLYGYSLTGCLPDGMSRAPSVGTGTVIRPATLAAYAAEAGFAATEVLDIEHDFFRFYRLVP